MKTPSEKLDGQSVPNAISAWYGPDRFDAVKIRKGFERLIHARSWSEQQCRSSQTGFPARYVAGSLKETLEFPCNLVLIRDGEDAYRLLCRMEQRWLYLDRDGNPLQELDDDEDEHVEAVLFNMLESKDRSSGFASLKALWPELRAAWAEVGIASLFINSGQLLLPIFALLIYDKIALNGLFETLWALVFGMALYLATDTAMRLIRSWSTERIGVDLARRSDERLWTKMLAQSDLPPGGVPRFLSNYRDLTLSRDFVSSSYLLQIADIPFLILYVGVIGLIAWQMMFVALVLVLMYAGIGMVLQSRQSRLSKEAEQKNTLKLAFMGESLHGLDVLRTSPGTGEFLRTWRSLSEESTRFDTQRRLAATQTATFSTIMQTLTTVVILTAGVYLIYAQLMTIGKLIACNILAGRAMAQVGSLFQVVGKRQDFLRSAERMGESLAEVEETECTPRHAIEGQISVLAIGKHYEERPAALEKVSFSIDPGERIALLGRPGAGKSTLLRCLAGLSRFDAGQILIDGLALEHISRFDRVKWMAYKAQDPVVFAGTLEDNLRISGCSDKDRFHRAIWASGLESEFKSGRMSLGMALQERGINLSGGQRQKVALARAFAQSSRILLLDEPTLGLDPESERLLADRLPQILDPSTVLVMTTHSSILLKMVHRIIALEGGRIAADGPREKLVTLQPGSPSSKGRSISAS